MKINCWSLMLVRLPALVIAMFLTGCFGSVGIDPTEDPVQPSKEAENISENSSNENSNAGLEETNSGVNSVTNAESNGKNSGDPETNNSSEENFLGGNAQENMFGNAQGNNNLLNNKNALANNLGGNAPNPSQDDALVNSASTDIPVNAAPDINGAAIDTETNNPEPIVERSNTPQEPTPNPSPIPDSSTVTAGLVRYVSPGGSRLLDKPNGNTVKPLEQGDHPLVTPEGEWSRTSDGYYIPSQTLTADPIARFKSPSEWR